MIGGPVDHWGGVTTAHVGKTPTAKGSNAMILRHGEFPVVPSSSAAKDNIVIDVALSSLQ